MDYIDRSPIFTFNLRTNTIISAGGEDSWPGKKVVCTYCNGMGAHSRHLGAIPLEEFDSWDDEDRDNYLDGAYDMVCEECRGERIVLEPDFNSMSEEDRKAYEEYVREEMEYRKLCEMERRLGA